MSEAIKGWKGSVVEGSYGFSLAAKSKGAKSFMKRWYSDHKGAEVGSKILEDSLAQVDAKARLGINFNSIVTLDIDSGRIAWAKQLGDYDVFYFPCLVPDNPDCPPGPNLDADFGEAPMLLTIYANGTIRDVVVAVQKSGFAWALNRDNGEIVWFKLAGPGGEEGGGQWGAATDGR
ncbi:hypothetical protein LWI29_020747 [Acer saccharum]|uniref:Uncharacterized protein n=1 Tax=Acer saccharum TaxID=4024 RepID=A0AA39SMA9_ACESA|nr:hypothetical protein LWI29_020747 [Acer saccharum]